MADAIRVVLVDDDPLTRVGLSTVLGADPRIEVVGEAADGAEAIDASARLRPDVVLMDIRMPGKDGITATAELRSAEDGPAVIVLTTYDTDDHILRALRVGANGFLLKDTAPREILDAVRRVAAGELMLSPPVLARLVDRAVHGADQERAARARRARELLARLTERERAVAAAIGEGKSNAEISGELYLSVATIKAEVSRILTRLECTNRVQVAILVYEAGS